MRARLVEAFAVPKLIALIGFLGVFASSALHAQTRVVVTPTLQVQVVEQVGSGYRDDLADAIKAIEAKDHAKASALLRSIMAFCDSLGRPGLSVVSVANDVEYDQFVNSRASSEPVEWADMVCPSAYKTAAFLSIEEQKSDDALRYLNSALTMAPYWADPLVEQGFLLNQLGRHQEALESYRRALELATSFDSNRNSMAIAYRGLGYTYVELKDLDRAEDAYEQSLALEPDNALARDELVFIKRQRKDK